MRNSGRGATDDVLRLGGVLHAGTDDDPIGTLLLDHRLGTPSS